MTREMAEEEFARFLSLMDLDTKVAEKMDAEDTKSLEKVRSTLIRAIENGSLFIEDDGVCVFTPRRGKDRKPFRFEEPGAGVLLAADKRREGHNGAKMVAILTAWSGENPQRFDLKPGDYEVVTSLFGLFFG